MKLNDICDIYSGYALKSFNDMAEGVPVIKIGNIIIDGTLNLSDCQYTTEKVDKKYYSQKGDIYVALSGATTGKIGIMQSDVKYIINQRVGIVRRKDVTYPDTYIKYFLMRQTDRILQDASGCAQPNISPRQIAEYNVPDLLKKEMEKICDILNKLTSIINNRKKQLEQLDNLIKARFVEMFGDGHGRKNGISKLGNFCKFQQGTQIPLDEQIDVEKSGYRRFLRIIDYTQAPQPPRYVCVNGRVIDEKAVVIVRYGATAGFVGRGYNGILANNLFEVIPDENVITRDFLYLVLKYGTFEKDIRDKAFGAAMPAISFGMMNDIAVVVPNMEDQNKFASFVHQADKSKIAVQKALDETQTLFNSLMQEYFA